MNKFLLITNDNFDASFSRLRFSNWLGKKKNISCDILCPSGINDFALEFGNVYYFDKRGLTFSNYQKLKTVLSNINYDVIIARGIENIILISLFSKKNNVFLLTGLGRLFEDGLVFKSIIRRLYKSLLKNLIKKNCAKLILQNKQDQTELDIEGSFVINGSGIEDSKISFNKSPTDVIRILTASRLNNSKGIEDIISFANQIKSDSRFEYFIIGGLESLNPYQKKTLYDLNDYNNIHVLGFKKSINKFLKKCHFAFYPTKYREGCPRFLIQAINFGLIPITTKMPGCTNFLTHGIFYKDVDQIIKEINYIIDSSNFKNLSKKNREIFLETYDEKIVFEKYFNISIT